LLKALRIKFMSMENPRVSSREKDKTKESSESVEAVVFKGVAALGAGVLRTLWDARVTSFLYVEEDDEGMDGKGFVERIKERTANYYQSLSDLEKTLDPSGNSHLPDYLEALLGSLTKVRP
jgi:hypothetical protein